SFRRLRETDLAPDFRLRVCLTRFVERDFFQRIGYLVHYVAHPENLDRACGFVEFSDQFFIRMEVLAGRDQHRILHRIQDDLWVDALFLGQDFDGLINRSQVHKMYEFFRSGVLPLELKIRLFNLIEWKLDLFSGRRLERDGALRETLQDSCPTAL